MTRIHIACSGIFVAAMGACSATVEQAGVPPDLTGTTAQPGMSMQGMSMQGMRLDGAVLSDKQWQLQVSKGELIATHSGKTLRGTALAGMHLFADVQNLQATPVTAAVAEYRITAIEPEDPEYDQTGTGNTFLYTLEQYISDDGSWAPACPADGDGRHVAIPLAAIWNASGDRVESTTQFTLGCTTGVIAKCYRWGYRPWITGYGNLVPMHQTCTRMARADYCGDGTPHTHDGTWINMWDSLPPPGPIQRHGGLLGLLPPVGMLFEAGWNTGGAVCLSHARWLLDDAALLAAACPDRLVPPSLLGGTVCDTVAAVLGFDPNAKMFNEAYLNL